MDWKKYIVNPKTKKPHRGAISRVAERLHVHFNTVKKMFHGTALPTAAEARMLRNIVHSRLNILAKKRSDAGKKRGKYRKRMVVLQEEVKKDFRRRP